MTLLEEDSCLSSSMGGETSTALLLDSSLSSSVSLDAGKTSSGGNVSSNDGLLGMDNISGSGNIRNRQESGSGITVWIVRTGSGGEASRQLWGSHGGGGEGKDNEGSHLDRYVCVCVC